VSYDEPATRRNLCPECAQGKPWNCIGWTLDDADEEVPCDVEVARVRGKHQEPAVKDSVHEVRGPTPWGVWVDEAVDWVGLGGIRHTLAPDQPAPDLDPEQDFG
jgi:hypothetical protein